MGAHPDDEVLPDPEPTARVRSLREMLWLPVGERQTRCARCTMTKRRILTLAYKTERFGICARCLEVLWSEIGYEP